MAGAIYSKGTVMNSSATRLFLSIAILFFVGCGSGSNDDVSDFVFTGQQSTTVTNGGPVTFNFVRAQSTIDVPADTVAIRFRFYSGANGTGVLLQEERRDFAPTITIDPVDGRTQSTVITALTADGFPVFEIQAALTPQSGEVTEFDAATGTAAIVTVDQFQVTPPSATIPEGGTQQFQASLLFSNGEVLPANNVVWSTTGQATVDTNSGLVTATTSGLASVTATRDTLTDTVDIIVGDGPILTTLTVTPDALTVGTGSSVQFSVTGVDQNNVPFPLTGIVWSITGDGTINATTGLASFPNVGTATITATVGTVSDSTTFTILESVPSVTLGDTSVLSILTTQTLNFATGVTVTDNQTDLDGGRLDLAVTGTAADATIDLSAGSNIGTVTDNNTSSPTVALNTNATPAAIATFLEAATITPGATFGTGTITIRLNDGEGNNAMPATRNFNVPDPTPVVTLDGGTLTFDVSQNPSIFSPGATVTDDQAAIGGGTLAFSLTGAVTDATFTAPGAPVIGTVNDNGTNMMSVTLNSGATPADIQTFLQAVTLTGNTRGTGTIQVDLTDGQANMATTATRDFEFTSLRLTVGATGADFTTIQAAIDQVEATTGAAGSTITVLANYAAGPETLTVPADPDLDGLQLLGQAAGQSAGSTPDPGRNATAQLTSVTINQPNVTLDGFDLEGGGTLVFARDVADLTVRNCAFVGNGVILFHAILTSNGADISNCSFTDFADPFLTTIPEAITLQSNGGNDPLIGGTLTGNTFLGCDRGVVLARCDGTQVVTGNAFHDSRFDHLFVSANNGEIIVVSGSEFSGTGAVTASDIGGAVPAFNLNASGNWWGNVAGPQLGQVNEDGLATITTAPFLTVDPFPGFGG